jgi:undecaprenyl-diphosphatase
VARVGGYCAALFVLMAVIGLLVTKVLEHTAPISTEDRVDRSLAAHRTPTGTRVTGWLSTLASTPVIIGMLIVVFVVFRLVYHRWRESVFLLLAVGTQTLVFLATAAVIKRDRPDVKHLDAAPPTSSFPSGHTGAATALFVGIALVVGWHVGRTWLRALLIVLALLVPFAVGYSRLYRGMHHPTDVAAGLLDGLLAVSIWARNLLLGVLPDRWSQALDGGAHRLAIRGADKAARVRG